MHVILKVWVLSLQSKNRQGKSRSESLFTAENIAEGNAPCLPRLGQVTYKI